jgi:S1-C subfamily serine protease
MFVQGRRGFVKCRGRVGWGAVSATILLLWAPGTPLLQAQDVDETLQSLVRVRASVAADATTARTLGTEREGNGILIDDEGLILTIGYLIVEADSIEVHAATGTFHADLVGYDGDTGFGLVQARALTGLHPMPLGESSRVEVGDSLQIGGFGNEAQRVHVISRGEFVGSWEYLLDSAVYTAPAYPDFGGAALISEGKLVGVGSILASFTQPGIGHFACNMFVPIDLLKPILKALIQSGHSNMPAHPWLGLNTAETEGRVVVTTVIPESPAEQSGLRPGDIILAVEQQPVAGVAEFYRRVWATGSAGVSVHLRVLQSDSICDIVVKSVNRSDRLRHSPSESGGIRASATTLGNFPFQPLYHLGTFMRQ